MNHTKKQYQKMLALVCILAVAQPGFCITLKPTKGGGFLQTIRQVMQRTKAAQNAAEGTVKVTNKNPDYLCIHFKTSRGVTFATVDSRPYYTAPKAGDVATVTLPQDKAITWANVHGQGENVAPVFAYDKFEDAAIEYATQRGAADVDRIASLVPYKGKESDLPDGPGMYRIWDFPTSRITLTINGITTEIKSGDFVMMQRMDENGDGVGDIRLYERSVEDDYARYYNKPISDAFLHLPEIPTDPQKFWTAIGGKDHYTKWHDLKGDIRMFRELAPFQLRNELYLGTATKTLGHYEYEFDFYTLPVEEITVGETTYRRTDSVMVIRDDGQSCSSIDSTDRVITESRDERSNYMAEVSDKIMFYTDLEKNFQDISLRND